MNIVNYTFAKESDRKQWLDSLEMNVGLKYFGGKSVIGRYIFNNIFNLSIQMQKDGKPADIFIDAFTGGGKIGLSVPKNWYDTIVINDLNYGVYSFYKSCKENHLALLKMIEKMGGVMSSDFFYLAGYLRSFGPNADKWGDGEEKVKSNEVIDPLVAGAMTYWVTSASFNGISDPDTMSYNFSAMIRDDDGKVIKDENGKGKEDRVKERGEIERAIKLAKKRIPALHERLNSMNYIIENLDYRELIKKYNGKGYKNIMEEDQKPDESLARKNKLWYFDPPYHPYCLYAGKDAPYANTFSVEMADEMVKILAGSKKEEYGEIAYFIKSDYDPKYALKNAEERLEQIKKGTYKTSDDQVKWFNEIRKIEEETPGAVSGVFASLEKEPFCKICVGGFDKGAVDANGMRDMGLEYIWCRGFEKGYAGESETDKSKD